MFSNTPTVSSSARRGNRLAARQFRVLVSGKAILLFLHCDPAAILPTANRYSGCRECQFRHLRFGVAARTGLAICKIFDKCVSEARSGRMMLFHRGIAASADALQCTHAEAPKGLPVAGTAPAWSLPCVRASATIRGRSQHVWFTRSAVTPYGSSSSLRYLPLLASFVECGISGTAR